MISVAQAEEHDPAGAQAAKARLLGIEVGKLRANKQSPRGGFMTIRKVKRDLGMPFFQDE